MPPTVSDVTPNENEPLIKSLRSTLDEVQSAVVQGERVLNSKLESVWRELGEWRERCAHVQTVADTLHARVDDTVNDRLYAHSNDLRAKEQCRLSCERSEGIYRLQLSEAQQRLDALNFLGMLGKYEISGASELDRVRRALGPGGQQLVATRGQQHMLQQQQFGNKWLSVALCEFDYQNKAVAALITFMVVVLGSTFVASATYYFACVAGDRILPSMRQYISDLNVQSVEMKGAIDELARVQQDQFREKENALQTLQRQYSTLSNDRARLVDELADTRQQMNEGQARAAAEVARVQQHLTEKENSLRILQRTQVALSDELAHLQRQLDDTKQIVQSLKRERSELAADRMRLEKIVVADTQIIASLREQIDGAPLNKIYKFIFRQNTNTRN